MSQTAFAERALAKLRTAKVLDGALMRAIFEALKVNGNMSRTWIDAKRTT